MDDSGFEADLARDPFSVRLWLSYADSLSGPATASARFLVLERAVSRLPGSYKLWTRYLNDRVSFSVSQAGDDDRRRSLAQCRLLYERAMVSMHRYPRVWLEYAGFLAAHFEVREAREAFDRALTALPPTQHAVVWERYLAFAGEVECPEMMLDVHDRLSAIDKSLAVEHAMAAVQCGRRGRAVGALIEALEEGATGAGDTWEFLLDLAAGGTGLSKGNSDEMNDDEMENEDVEDDAGYDLGGPQAKRARTEEPNGAGADSADAAGGRLFDKHGDEIDVEAVVRSGLRRFAKGTGRGDLYCALASFHARRGDFERARDAYEEGIATVGTAREFAQVYDAYTALEESLVTAHMRLAEESGGDDGDDDDDNDAAVDLEISLARFEHLVARLPDLRSAVTLRQNPHSVDAWLSRARLFESDADPRRCEEIYEDAIATVDAKCCVGRPNDIWIAYAKWRENRSEIQLAREVLDRGFDWPFADGRDLAEVMCERVELELRVGDHAAAREAASQAVASALRFKSTRPGTAHARVHRSPRVWSLHIDLEESLGTFATARDAYESAVASKAATPQLMLNYAAFLEDNRHYEAAFAVYDKGTTLFPHPHNAGIWEAYIAKFVERYGGSKVERARDLFETAVASCPARAPELKALHLRRVAFEKEYGLSKDVFAALESAVASVPPGDLCETWLVYARTAEELEGPSRARDVLTRAMDTLERPGDVVKCALAFASLETRLGEHERARALYTHTARYADPATEQRFWDNWHTLEVSHGDEVSFREMLRVRRTLLATVFAGSADKVTGRSHGKSHGNSHGFGATAASSSNSAEERARKEEEARKAQEEAREDRERLIAATGGEAAVAAPSAPRVMAFGSGGTLQPPGALSAAANVIPVQGQEQEQQQQQQQQPATTASPDEIDIDNL